jgi:hypothetical protein
MGCTSSNGSQSHLHPNSRHQEILEIPTLKLLKNS